MKAATGKTFEYKFDFTQAQVVQFAGVTGDLNPVHLDEAYAAQTPFKKPIVHGFLSGSVFSKVFGTIFPGEGTIYLGQDMQFKRPMYVNTAYTAHFTIVETEPEKGILVVDCKILDPAGKVCLEGNARLLNKNVF